MAKAGVDLHTRAQWSNPCGNKGAFDHDSISLERSAFLGLFVAFFFFFVEQSDPECIMGSPTESNQDKKGKL